MKRYKYIIIGGGIAGTTAAETIRDKDKNGSIAIINKENETLYSRVLLPKFLEGLFSKDKIILRSKEDEVKKNIDLFLGEEVLSIDTKKSKIFLKDRDVSYEKLLIATGLEPRRLNVEGDICYFQSMKDVYFLKDKISKINRVVILGGSFNALELAEAFSKNNIKTTILLRSNKFLGSFLNNKSSFIIKNNLEKNGISVFYEEEFSYFSKEGDDKYLVSKKGNKFKYDLVVASIGTKFNSDFLSGSGIKINKGILSDERLKTNIDNVFVAGDVAEFYDVLSGKHQMFRNWVSAFMQGKVAGINMLGGNHIFKHVSGYNVVNFGLNISMIGDVSLDKKVVVLNREDKKTGGYTRLFLRDNILCGSVQINMNSEQRISTILIENKIDLTKYKDFLEDINFDLNNIIKK